MAVVVGPAALTRTVGNLFALTQSNGKRMLAYSSIAHTGYMLVGPAASAAGRSEGRAGRRYSGPAYPLRDPGACAAAAAPQARGGLARRLCRPAR